jgi:hypothetical protein
VNGLPYLVIPAQAGIQLLPLLSSFPLLVIPANAGIQFLILICLSSSLFVLARHSGESRTAQGRMPGANIRVANGPKGTRQEPCVIQCLCFDFSLEHELSLALRPRESLFLLVQEK